MSLKHEIDKIKGVGTDHAKLARDYYINIVKKDVEHIKEEILKQAKEGQDGYTGILNLEFNQGKDTSYNIQYTLPGNYEGALAVITSAANRCHSSRWKSYGSTILEQLTAPSQYCYSIDNYWRKYLGGNVPDNVKQAVADGLNGKTNHSYTCFRSTSGGDPTRVNIGGNWYFGD